MNEADWVKLIAKKIEESLGRSSSLWVQTAKRLAYGYEIVSYGEKPRTKSAKYQTDLLISESGEDGTWKPRVVLEAKIRSVTTHDAITYSQKAAAHRAVHPYLRYGIILGNRRHYPLPGRLYRHGQHFDFMFSFVSTKPMPKELAEFKKLIQAEIRASRTMERILYESRKPDRDHYTLLHRRLVLR